MGNCKFYKLIKQVSYDNGQTWQNLSETRAGDLYERDSADCMPYEKIYRWVNLDPTTDYVCNGTTKYYKQQKQVSTDNGETWQNVIPAEYQRGGVYEYNSEDCGYVPPTPTGTTKLSATYSDSSNYELECNSSSILTRSETQPSGYVASAMTSAVVGDCVTTISTWAFRNCYSLQNVTLPNSLIELGNNCFLNCSGLTSVNIPSNTKWIDSGCFYKNINLRSITIPSSITYIGSDAFYETPWWSTYSADTSHQYNGIIYINDVAYKSTATTITNATLRNDTVCVGGGVFYGCSSLASLEIPSGVIYIGDSAFHNCSSLTTINIPSGVTYIGNHAFYHCSSLTSITIPSGVTSIYSETFAGCSSLTSVDIPSGVTSIGAGAFINCTSLQSITVRATIPPSGAYNHVFDNTNDCPIYVPSQSVNAYKSASGWSDYASRIQAIP